MMHSQRSQLVTPDVVIGGAPPSPIVRWVWWGVYKMYVVGRLS
jgi:hypothetical protein